jgi:hypothetical protein
MLHSPRPMRDESKRPMMTLSVRCPTRLTLLFVALAYRGGKQDEGPKIVEPANGWCSSSAGSTAQPRSAGG